jgi:MinD-like ATPase involved in chromosome partitioning or flagellar assembly
VKKFARFFRKRLQFFAKQFSITQQHANKGAYMCSNYPDGSHEHFHLQNIANEQYHIVYNAELKDQKRLINQSIKTGAKFNTEHEQKTIEEFIAREIEDGPEFQKRFKAAVLLQLKKKDDEAAKAFKEIVSDVLQHFAEEVAHDFTLLITKER